MNTETQKIKTSIRYMLLFFMVALAISGATAIPVETELASLIPNLPEGNIRALLQSVLVAVQRTNLDYPFLFYGYDWLAFAHFVIAVAFIGPFVNPVKNIWVIEFGLIACAMVIPFALIIGGLRGLPLYWRLIDCSFGVIGAMPLWYCRKKILQLEKMITADKMNIVF